MMKTKINQTELRALIAISESNAPVLNKDLGARYRWVCCALTAFAILFSLMAICYPHVLVYAVKPNFAFASLSPNIQLTDNLIHNAQIRGAFTLLLVVFGVLSHAKPKVTLAILYGFLFWVTSITVMDIYKLVYFQFFTASPATAFYLMTRPLLLVGLVVMIMDLRSYLKESNASDC